MKRDPFIYIGVAVATFLFVMLALFAPELTPAPAALLGVVLGLWFTRRADRPRKAHPCQQCGRRFKGADMVEHHVNEHRVCDS